MISMQSYKFSLKIPPKTQKINEIAEDLLYLQQRIYNCC
jgi:hypothetical protein